MNFSATSEFEATSATAVTYSFLPDPWDIVLEFQKVETIALGGPGRKIHNGPVGWTSLVVAPRYRFSPFSIRILNRIKPLIGAGLGLYLLDHSLSAAGVSALLEDCDVIRGQGRPVCAVPEEKLTSVPGVHAEAGLDFVLFWGWRLSVEGRWLSLTPNIVTDNILQNPGADPPTTGNREPLQILQAAQYFTILNAMLRHQF